jgi:hypothetical protein
LFGVGCREFKISYRVLCARSTDDKCFIQFSYIVKLFGDNTISRFYKIKEVENPHANT